jgi:hypothetical protein
MTNDQIDTLLDTVEKLKHIEISLIHVRGLVHHDSESWRGFLAAQTREWLTHLDTLTAIVGESKALELASRFSPLAKPI